MSAAMTAVQLNSLKMKRMTGVYLQHLGLQSEDYTTSDSAPEVCEVQSVDQVLDQQLTRPEEEMEEEVAEDKTTFLDALKGLETARKYMCQFDTKDNITVMCNKVENELYRPRTQEKRNNQLLLTG
jgi:hypothetical protein